MIKYYVVDSMLYAYYKDTGSVLSFECGTYTRAADILHFMKIDQPTEKEFKQWKKKYRHPQ